MHVGGLLTANVSLVTLLSSEQCSQIERFRPQDVQMLNKNHPIKTIDWQYCRGEQS